MTRHKDAILMVVIIICIGNIYINANNDRTQMVSGAMFILLQILTLVYIIKVKRG